VKHSPLRAVTGVLADPMLRNGHALIASGSMTQLVGVLYWIFAARLYPVAVVGRNSAAVSIMLFLSGVAELNLMSTLVRFLPTSGKRTVRLIITVYVTSAAIGAVIGTVFLFLIPRVEPQLDFLRSGPYIALWFVFSISLGTIFVLEDSALTGVRAATFVPIENGTFSVLKLALLVPLVRLLPAAGIYVSWTAAIALAVVPTNAYLFGRAVPRHLRLYSVATPVPRFRDIRAFLIPDSVAALFLLASTALLPLLIIDRLGPSAAGHYALAWIIGYSLFLVSLNMGFSLVVETAADQSELRRLSRRSMTHLAKLLVPVVAVILVAAPYILLAFGPGYAQADVTPLRLLALASLPALITNTAISATRSQRRMRMVLGIQVTICVLVWGLSAALMGHFGITGVAAAWLIAQTATALVLAARPRSWLPAAPHGAPPLDVRDRDRSADCGPAREIPVASAWEARLDGRPIRVSSPIPTEIWAEVAEADPSATPFQWPAWRDCVCSSGKWQDASRLYELPGGRRVVLMLARRSGWPARLAPAASWPAGWGTGGVVAPGGVRPKEVAMVCDDLAAGQSLSVSARPGYAAAPIWAGVADSGFVVPRTVHVAECGGSFDEYFARSLTVSQRARLRSAERHLERAGVVMSSGNSPDLVRSFYQVYLRWIEWRAVQRREPVPLALWRARRSEPFEKFATVASRLGPACHICVAALDDMPIGAMMSLHAADTAVSWRVFTDRAAAPARFRLFELLPVEALRHACECGCRQIEMGESVGKRDLTQITERLGAREVSSPEYCFQRLPVAQGRLAFQKYRARAEHWLIARTGDPARSAEATR
jgi:O-antigen/teichoic acid export membrane protein